MIGIRAEKKLRIAALLDGRPGHEKQTRGILYALQQKCPVEIIELKVGRLALLAEVMQTGRLFLPGSIDSAADWPIGKIDLVLGTGSRTHLPMLCYKKKHAVPVLTCMAPPRYLRHRFDLCFIPEHDGVAAGNNVMLTVGAPNCSINKNVHHAGCGLIVLGGVDDKSHHWPSRQMVAMIEKIVSIDRDTSWTIASSPRTPPDTVALIPELLPRYDNIAFFDYKDTPPGWIEEQYDRSSVVWVSADSISMVYEALSAGCRVGILPVQWRRKNGKFSRNQQILLDKELVTPFDAWQQGEIALREPKELNEAQRCAEEIVQRWWPENLP